MLPIYKRFEECMNAQLLTPEQRRQGYFLEHKLDGLLRGDSASRMAMYAAGRQWGFMSANDCRRLENLPAIPNGDIYLTPTNMVEAGKQDTNAVSNKMLDEISAILKER